MNFFCEHHKEKGYLRKGNVEALLNLLQDLLVLGAADERDTQTLGTKTAGTADTMQVRIGSIGHIIVDSNVDALNVDTATEDVRGDTDTGLELLELLVTLDTARCQSAMLTTQKTLSNLPLLLTDAGVDRRAGKVALAQELIKLCAAQRRTNEDDDLIELERVQQIVELAVLLALIELDKVLLQTVQGKLLLVVNVDLQRVLHELLADDTRLLGESSGKHHNLLVGRGGAEDGLHIIAHI